MNIGVFLIENNIVGITMGTIVDFGLTNWVKEFRNTLIIPFVIERFELSQTYGEMTSATIEVIILVILITILLTIILTIVILTIIILPIINISILGIWSFTI